MNIHTSSIQHQKQKHFTLHLLLGKEGANRHSTKAHPQAGHRVLTPLIHAPGARCNGTGRLQKPASPDSEAARGPRSRRGGPAISRRAGRRALQVTGSGVPLGGRGSAGPAAAPSDGREAGPRDRRRLTLCSRTLM